MWIHQFHAKLTHFPFHPLFLPLCGCLMATAEGIQEFGEGWLPLQAGGSQPGEGVILHVGLGLQTFVALGCEHAHGERLKHSHAETEYFGLGQNNIFLVSFQLQVLEMASLQLGILWFKLIR